MKKIISLLLIVTICSVSMSGCGYKYKELQLESKYDKSLSGTVLNVYNWGEYISDGSDDSIDVNKEFEKLTGIKINYSTYDSNETMYSQLKSESVSYDVIIPSDYMIEQLKNEKMLKKIDFDKVPNYKYIDDEYKNLDYDKNNEYSVAYNVGMVGIIYDKKQIPNPEHSWKELWNPKYKDLALNFSNPRDCFMTAQMIIGDQKGIENRLNSENLSDWDEAFELLKKGKDNLQSYVMDEIYGKMETGEAAIGPYYAGDYLTRLDVNPDLGFFYPDEGTNIFVDAMCIPSCAKHYEAALMYINFMLEPDIALANANYIGYASPHTEVCKNEDYDYYQDPILYPSEDDLPENYHKEYYHAMKPKIRKYYENLWIDLKLY